MPAVSQNSDRSKAQYIQSAGSQSKSSPFLCDVKPQEGTLVIAIGFYLTDVNCSDTTIQHNLSLQIEVAVAPEWTKSIGYYMCCLKKIAPDAVHKTLNYCCTISNILSLKIILNV